MGGFYVVVVGRKPGVYDNWLETHAQIDGISGPRHAKFRFRDDAYALFEAARARGEVRAVDASLRTVPGVQVSPMNAGSLDLPNETYPGNEPLRHHLSTASESPNLQSSTLVSGNHNATQQPPEIFEASRPSTEKQSAEQSMTPGRQRCAQISTAENFRTVGVQTIELHVPSNRISTNRQSERGWPIHRPRPSRIQQRDVDSDLSEPESLVSVEIVDKKSYSKSKNVSAFPPSHPTPAPGATGISPSHRHRTTEPAKRHNTSSSRSVQAYSTPTSKSSISNSRHAVVSLDYDVGYPSGTESSGPEDVTPRKSQAARRDLKGKGKQSPLVMISSDSDSDPSTSEIATPSRGSIRSAEVVGVNKSRETSSRRDVSAQGSRRSGSSRKYISEGSNVYSQPDSMEDEKSLPHSFMLEALGLSQPAHVPLQLYEPGSDPRSPMRKTVLVPETERPSPRPAHSLVLPFPSLLTS
ncbi:hypothetical protein L218DRAFT_538470 [Marasmius fiardii PR-910]|nr:hypothetical protein L218DRAFT_538470 [Marasmius fiardii PR-910]